MTATCLVAQADAESGLKRYVVHGQGISLALPASWRTLDSQQARTDRKATARFVQGNPDFLAVAIQLSHADRPFKFGAIDPKVHFRTRERAFRASTSVLVNAKPAGLTFERHRRTLVKQLRNYVGPDATIVDDVVMISGKKALRLRIERKLEVDQTTLTILDFRYSFVRPTRIIDITYETVKQAASRYKSLFDTSARSIQIR